MGHLKRVAQASVPDVDWVGYCINTNVTSLLPGVHVFETCV